MRLPSTTNRFVAIRRLTANDVNALKQFFEVNDLPFFNEAAECAEKHLAAFLQVPTKSCFAAFSREVESFHGEIVGFGSIDVLARPRGGRIAYLGEVYVSNAYRRKGVATKIVHSVTEEADRLACHQVILHCSYDTIGFYERTGFSVWERGMRLEMGK